MVYKLFKIWAQLAFSLYFRRIFISGKEHIPKKGAVLILVNHPNSFLEPCVIAAFQHRNLHFLVRGDVFEKKWLLPILTSTNQIPIFRAKDGFGKLRSNKNTFVQANKVLADQHTLMMFPEASSEMVKYLRPLQKGAARLALGAFEDNNIDELIVIPAGIHYYKAPKSRNDVILKFGHAIRIKSWLDQNIQADDKLSGLTAYLQDEMNKVVISITHIDHERIYNDAYIIAENDQLPFKSAGLLPTEEGYAFLKNLITRLNQLPEQTLIGLGDLMDEYKGSFDDLKSFDHSVLSSQSDKLKILFLMSLFFLSGLGGFLVYAPSLFFSKWFAKTKIKHITFYAPVRVAVNMGTHLITTLILFGILVNYMNIFETIVVLLLLQLSLFCFAYFMDYSRYVKYLFNKDIINNKEELLRRRKQIVALIKD